MLCVTEMKMVKNSKAKLADLGKSQFTSDCNNSVMYCFISALTKKKKKKAFGICIFSKNDGSWELVCNYLYCLPNVSCTRMYGVLGHLDLRALSTT